MSAPLPRLTATQTAARLGVKPETLYAYVSRGLLARERDAHGSTFDALEVEAFAAGRRRSAAHAPAHPTTGMPLGILHTDIADIEDDELLFRGRRARDLVDRPFAEVVAWLWDAERVDAPDPAIGSAREMVAALPPHADAMDRLRAALTGFAADDPLRHDTSPATLHRIGWTLLTGLPVALGGDPDPDIALALSRSWNAPASVGPALNAALVLLIDHDLAVSTFAARVAASARADGYAAVSAALGAADSPCTSPQPPARPACSRACGGASTPSGPWPKRCRTATASRASGTRSTAGSTTAPRPCSPTSPRSRTAKGRWMPCAGSPRS